MSKVLLCIITGLMFSCVSQRKMNYLQGPNSRQIPHNTPVRQFTDSKAPAYKLCPDDVVSIRISSATPSEYNFFNYRNDNSVRDVGSNDPLLNGYIIHGDGTIELPVVGNVKIAQLTIPQARDTIRRLVENYLESPTVSVRLLSFQYTVLGEVEKQGRFTSYHTGMTVLQALGDAGGLTDFADRKNVKIVRTANDTTSIVYINLLDENLINSPYYHLRPNDVVAVGPLRAKNWRQNNTTVIGLILSGITAVSLILLRVQ